MSIPRSALALGARQATAGSVASRQLAVLSVLLCTAYAPLLTVYVRQLWLRPHYQFVLLVPVGSAILAVARLRELGRLKPPRARWSYSFAALALVLTAAAVLLFSSWLGAVALLATLAAAFYGIGGRRLLGRLLPAWGLLWLAIPPPFELDRELILALQTLTAQWSSGLLDLLGVFHVMSGHVVEIGGRRLLVEEACSGINSLFSVLACTVFFVFWARRPRFRAILLVVAALGWVLLSNVARVAGVTYLSTACGIDLTEGWRHEAFGFALFGLTLVLIWSTDRLLAFLAAPPPQIRKQGDSQTRKQIQPTRLPDLRTTWLGSWPMAGAFAVLIVMQFSFFGPRTRQAAAAADTVAPSIATLAAEMMPARWERWERLGFTSEHRDPGSAFGEFSKIWDYHLGQNKAALSLDYPFPGWHDLARCYTSAGWTIQGQCLCEATGTRASGYVEVNLAKSAYRSGYLLFSQFDRTGVMLKPRLGGAYLAAHRHELSLRRWRSRLSGETVDLVEEPGPVYQFQLFVETYTPLSEAEQGEAKRFFLRGLSNLRGQWLSE